MSTSAKATTTDEPVKHLLDLLPHKTSESAKKKKSKEKRSHRGRWIAVSIVGFVLVALIAGAGGAYAYYSNRILPGVSAADVNLGGKTKAEAKQLLTAKIDSFAVIIQNGETTWKPTPEQLGVSFNVDQTVDQAFAQGREGSVNDRLALVQGKQVQLLYNYDKTKTDQFIADIVHATSKQPTDAALTVSGGAVVVNPEVWGQTTGVENATQRVAQSISNPAQIILTVQDIKLEPKIKAADLAAPLTQAQTMQNLPVTLTYNGKTFSPTVAQKAGWLDLVADPDNHTFHASFDKARVIAYVDSVAKTINVAAVPKKILVNVDNNGEQSLLQDGANGLAVDKQADVGLALFTSLAAGKAFATALTASPVAFATVYQNVYDRWIDIDLTTQTMTAYEKGNVVLKTLISSGIAMFPTPTGTFHIYGKVASTEMKGELGTPYAYDLPNVQWVSWWYGSYAIHGTYWHHNFGHPMSHGCINATNADAKFIYDWAPVGTAVVIHK